MAEARRFWYNYHANARACGAAVAQVTHNHLVVGSNPTGPTNKITHKRGREVYPGLFALPPLHSVKQPYFTSAAPAGGLHSGKKVLDTIFAVWPRVSGLFGLK